MAAARNAESGRKPEDGSEAAQAGKSENNPSADNAATDGSGSADLSQLLRNQNRELKRLMTAEPADPRAILRLWGPRARAEDDMLDPAIRRTGGGTEVLDEAAVRRDLIRILLGAALATNEDDPVRAALLRVLGSEFDTLVALEERPTTGLLALAGKAEISGPQVQASLQADRPDQTDWLRPHTIHIAKTFMRGRQDREEQQMARESWMRDRDDEGRFVSDDRDYGRRSRTPDRDEYGRFVSDGDRRSYGRSRDYDDDRGYRGSRNGDYERSSSGRGHGGWYGDPEGHAEAARRGWDEREGGSRDDDRDYGRSRYGRDRDENGRFMSEDERRYSRSRYDDDERRGSGRGHGGWFGDPEGHSEASRRGWEERRDEDRGYRSRSSSYDDDRRSSRGRGHGGWHGDPEGHSEAARRGWDERR